VRSGSRSDAGFMGVKVGAFYFRSKWNCDNPANNPKQLKTTFVGVVLLSLIKNHHSKVSLQSMTSRKIVAFVEGTLGSWYNASWTEYHSLLFNKLRLSFNNQN
jgi:hypothetical protein